MIKMNEELKITNEDIELLKEMKENCLKADIFDEKRLLKANAITKFLILQNNWNELKKVIEKEIEKTYELTTEDLKKERDLAISVYKYIQWKMQKLEEK